MTSQAAVHVMAGTFIMVGVVLTHWVSKYFLILIGFVGLNLFQYGFSDMCPAEIIFRFLGFRDARCPYSMLKGENRPGTQTIANSKVVIMPDNGAEEKV